MVIPLRTDVCANADSFDEERIAKGMGGIVDEINKSRRPQEGRVDFLQSSSSLVDTRCSPSMVASSLADDPCQIVKSSCPRARAVHRLQEYPMSGYGPKRSTLARPSRQEILVKLTRHNNPYGCKVRDARFKWLDITRSKATTRGIKKDPRHALLHGKTAQ